jgi:hypothetical protein
LECFFELFTGKKIPRNRGEKTGGRVEREFNRVRVHDAADVFEEEVPRRDVYSVA